MRAARRIAAVVAAAWVAPTVARADDMEGNAVYMPMPAGEALTVKNPLGAVTVRGWDQPEVRIVAAKRARSGGLLDRLKVRVDLASGKLDVTAGVYLRDSGWHPLPLDGGRIDLTIDAPRGMVLRASTFAGDIDASGLRAGARLTSETGEIRAADITGPVETRSSDGRQSLQSIRGQLHASGLVGDVELESIEGETVEVRVWKGQITARAVRTPMVQLRTTIGTIVLVGALRPGGRYELSTHDGDIRLTLAPSPFRLVAEGREVRSAFRLDGGGAARAGFLSGEFRGGGASLELVSATGVVSLAAAQQ